MDLQMCLTILREGRDRDDIYAACCDLRKFGAPAIPSLLEILSNPVEPEIARSRAAGVLGDMRVKEALPVLLAALEDPSASLRWHVVKALGVLGDRAAIPVLKKVAAVDHGEVVVMPTFILRVNEAATEALQALGAKL